MADYIYSMETRLTPDQQSGVNLVQEIARHAGLNLYLTGGTIRDLITGFPIRDIDLSIQGNPLKLQKELEKAGISVQGVDEDLRILHLLMPGNVRAELNMTRVGDVRQARQAARALRPATINEDLRRRDFTVNAMALSLNPGSRGLLLDPVQRRRRHRSQGAARPAQLRVPGRAGPADPGDPAERAFPLAAGRADPGALRRRQREQLHRVHRQAADRLRAGAAGARRRSRCTSCARWTKKAG